MIKDLEQLLFIFTEDFTVSLDKQCLKITAKDCHIEIEEVSADKNFCKVFFSYLHKPTLDYGHEYLKKSILCKIEEIASFLQFCYEKINLSSIHNRLQIEAMGLGEFLLKQAKVLAVLKRSDCKQKVKKLFMSYEIDDGLEYIIKVNHPDFQAHSVGGLQLEVYSSDIGDFTLFMPYQNIPQYPALKLSNTQFFPLSSREDCLNCLINDLSKDIDFIEIAVRKISLENILEVKGEEGNKKKI